MYDKVDYGNCMNKLGFVRFGMCRVCGCFFVFSETRVCHGPVSRAETWSLVFGRQGWTRWFVGGWFDVGFACGCRPGFGD